MGIETHFDVGFVAKLTSEEKQIQQNYRPVIGVHKWFARRPGALFRSLLLAEFTSGVPLAENYFQGHSLEGLTIADPFMGGGTTLFEANRAGCNVVGFDINPMAFWVVRQELVCVDRAEFRSSSAKVIESIEQEVGELYRTRCVKCRHDVPVKYFLWVKQQRCGGCSRDLDLFPGYLVAEDERHLAHFTEGLSGVFSSAARGLKAGAPFVFTYHHNDVEAYVPVVVALLDAGLLCTATLPCPAEMSASLHINGTGSSIVDTVIVCRRYAVPAKRPSIDKQSLREWLLADRVGLLRGEVRCTRGDLFCLSLGHLSRVVIASYLASWERSATVAEKMATVERALRTSFAKCEVEAVVADVLAASVPDMQLDLRRESLQAGLFDKMAHSAH